MIAEHAGEMTTTTHAGAADRFLAEQLFEEDVRAVLGMMRPHRRERLLGWAEYRCGGPHFRATVSWDPRLDSEQPDRKLAVPNMVDVLESILVGATRGDAELTPTEEFDLYRQVVRELYHRVNQMQACYE